MPSGKPPKDRFELKLEQPFVVVIDMFGIDGWWPGHWTDSAETPLQLRKTDTKAIFHSKAEDETMQLLLKGETVRLVSLQNLKPVVADFWLTQEDGIQVLHVLCEQKPSRS